METNKRRCPECGSEDITAEKNGHTTCLDCGRRKKHNDFYKLKDDKMKDNIKSKKTEEIQARSFELTYICDKGRTHTIKQGKVDNYKFNIIIEDEMRKNKIDELCWT